MRVIDLAQPHIGLRGFIVLHSTTLGPAFGGIRLSRYADDESCRADAARLAEAMTYKCAYHDIPGGGGKAAVRADLIKDRPAAIRAIGEVVESLQGSFFTGPDTGITEDDIAILSRTTRYVSTEDVTDATARGVLAAIRAACDHAQVLLDGATVAIQGLGAVGGELARRLIRLGAEVLGTDVDPAACERSRDDGVTILPTEGFAEKQCDVLSPCALGGVISAEGAARLRTRVVAGAANNVLVSEAAADALTRRGITFVPDFVANGGGVIRGAWVHLRGTPGSNEELDAIYDRVRDTLSEADSRGITPLASARDRVSRRLEGR
jgi:leucine dehydrogenase